jgi:hypothetical protein
VRQKGFTPILIILLVLIAIGGAYYFGTKKGSIIPIPTQITTPTATSTNIQTTATIKPTTDLTANWNIKTYSTYIIKYPSSLTVNEREGSIFTLSKWGPTQMEGTELYDGFSISFQPRELPNVTPIDFANSHIKESVDTGISELIAGPTPVTVNGYKGVTYTIQGLGRYKDIVLASNDNIMLMHVSMLVNDPGNIGFQKTVDQILSTFKFTQ